MKINEKIEINNKKDQKNKIKKISTCSDFFLSKSM